MKKLFLVVLACLVALPIAGLGANSYVEWPNMMHDDAHTNYSSSTTLPEVMQRNWVYYSDGTIYSHFAKGDKLYFADTNGIVAALNQSNGQEAWRYEIGKPGQVMVGSSNDLLIYVRVDMQMPSGGGGTGGGRGGRGGGGGRGPHAMTTNSGDFNFTTNAEEDPRTMTFGALNLETGEEIWRKELEGTEIMGGGLITDDKAYVAFADTNTRPATYRLACIDPANGNELWSTPYDKSLGQLLTLGDGMLYSSGLVVELQEDNPMGGTIKETNIVAFDLNGKIAWEKKLGERIMVGMISYDNGNIYFGNVNIPEQFSMRDIPESFINSYDAKTGEKNWSFGLKEFKYKEEPMGDMLLFGLPSVTSNSIIVQCMISKTIALDKNTGALKWASTTPGGVSYTGIQYSVAKNVVASVRGSKFSLTDIMSGEVIFTDDTKMESSLFGGSMIMPIPIIANDKVFVSGDRIICYGEKVIGLYSDPPEVIIDQIYPNETKIRKIRVYYNDSAEIDGTLSTSESWIKLSSTTYKTASQTYEVSVSSEGMEPGEYRGTIDVDSTVGKLSIPVIMNVSPKPPIKLVVNLEDTSYTNQNPFKVTGSTAPGATVSVNERPISVKTDGSFEEMIPIKDGENRLNFHAQDNKGNIADIAKVVILDDRKPIIRTNLKDGTFVTELPFTFLGSTEPGAKLLVNDEPTEVAPNGEFEAVITELENGEQTIAMFAKDVAGNTFKLERMISVDTTPLPLELDVELIQDQFTTTNKKEFEITGTTAPMSAVTVLLNMSPVGGAMSDTEGKFTIKFPVEDGQYRVSVSVQSQTGKTVDASFMLIVDTVAPVIECDVPELVEESKLVITGQTEPTTTIVIGEVTTQSDKEGKFIIEVELKPGLNSLKIKAFDSAGNSSSVTKYVKLQEKVEIQTIRLKLWVNKKDFYINGEKSADLDPMPTSKSPPLPANLAGNTYMPVRAILEALGAEIGWDATERRVDVTLAKPDGTKTFLQLWIDKPTAKLDGKEVQIVGADGKTALYPTIVGGRTMLPLRFAVESVGGSVGWIASEQAIEIVYPAE
ncbi:MAG TPA: PQQ-binding-like beta-propeller repeat protein [Caldisericia bacterium]|nr:PQQ-binding-like beta-propeller repeat protein [Caldisericia bacterium]HPF48994.1 PQQ-binding-like beta-propeller repeat protein [Caldisericia bacterium]HPI83142.1 PQQ-binding-like beta-propeller repeat protein [Caldisericia bacterium]HPQ92369.1 PQQ-binding-like beta-propeller repeat protein [Caldisericia bacterium]HRV74533.1 PQQ-binding-like beta-propeller repeat protein [Caldisericia bacterium]